MNDRQHLSNDAKVGSTHIGYVTNIQSYGVFVQFGKHSGLCHKSAIPDSILIGQLLIGKRVKVTIISIKDDYKFSLALVEILQTKRLGGDKEKPEPLSDGAIVGHSAGYSKGIGNAVKQGVDAINDVGMQFKNNPAPSRTGFVAEPDHASTFNIDSTFQGTNVHADRLASNGLSSPDIVIKDGAGNTIKEVSSKVYKDAKSTASAQRQYRQQERLVPHDQAEAVKTYAKRRVATERSKGTPERQQVANEYQEVADHTTDRLKHDGVESRPRTREESRELAEKARDGKVVGNDIIGDLGTRVKQGATQGAKSGAIFATAISSVTSTAQAVRNVRSGKMEVSEAVKSVAFQVTTSAVDGGLKGAASGAATAAARVAVEKVTSTSLKKVLGGSAPAAVAIAAVEIAKHSIDYARGRKTAEDFRQASKDTMINGSASFVGAEIGFLIGGPVGALIGGIAGPWLVETGANYFGQSGERRLGLRSDLEHLLHQNASGHDGATAYHMAQLEQMLSALSASDAVIFPDRVLLTETGHHTSAEVVLVYSGKVYVADFKAWKGNLDFPEVLETRTVVEKGWIWDSTKEISVPTGTFDTKHLNQVKIDQYGCTHTKSHRNPISSLKQFTWHLKQRLLASDRRWKHVQIKALSVFPDNEVVIGDSLKQTGQFVMFSDFLGLMSTKENRHTPDWMLNSLSTTPTWDVIQDPKGNLYRGIIQTPKFSIKLDDGAIDVPFDAVLKLEVGKSANLSRPDEARVTLNDQSIIHGVLENPKIVLKRKGHLTSFSLDNLGLVCPAFTLFNSRP